MSEPRTIYQKCGQCKNFFPPEDRECPYCNQFVEHPDFGAPPTAQSTMPHKRNSYTPLLLLVRHRRAACRGGAWVEAWVETQVQQAIAVEEALYAQSQTLYEAQLEALHAQTQATLQEQLLRLPPNAWRQARTLQDQAQSVYDAQARVLHIQTQATHEAQVQDAFPGWMRWLGIIE